MVWIILAGVGGGWENRPGGGQSALAGAGVDFEDSLLLSPLCSVLFSADLDSEAFDSPVFESLPFESLLFESPDLDSADLDSPDLPSPDSPLKLAGGAAPLLA